MSNNWIDFYKSRVNSSYQQYFNQKYAGMIEMIVNQQPKVLKEEGVGIGSLIKALQPLLPDTKFIGSDNNRKMLELCRENVSNVELFHEDITNHSVDYRGIDLVVSHGVLEHFEDAVIHYILQKYENAGVESLHYVPTDHYESPSFGDERLLPWQHWVKIKAPYMVVCQQGDLYLHYKPVKVVQPVPFVEKTLVLG